MDRVRCIINLGFGLSDRTSKHLELFGYLGGGITHAPSYRRTFSYWLVDLPRIVTYFGANFIYRLAAIHTIVPLFCLRNPAVFTLANSPRRDIKLAGAWDAEWDGRVRSITYDTYASLAASMDYRFDAGVSSGVT